MKSLFHNPTIRHWLVKLRAPLALIAVVVLAKFSQPQYMLGGFIVSLVGQLIQLWCFAVLEKNTNLASRGPYAFVRNPMYLGRYLIVIGLLITTGIWWLVAVVSVVYYLYMNARVQREEARLIDEFGESYLGYCKKVKRFLPTFQKVSDVVLLGNLKTFKINNGHKNAVGFAIIWAVLYFAMRYFNQ